MRAQALLRPRRFALPLSAAALALLLAAAAPAPPASSARPAAPAPPAAPGGWDHDWARGAVFYEVVVRSFRDSNGDGKGDLQGLISKLDSLNDGNPHSFGDLGVDALWLSGITAGGHVLPEAGTDPDFTQLLAAAHKRGMKVIVDLAVPASGQHPQFADADLWLTRGVDGFRLAATPPEAVLKELAAHVRAIHPQAVLVGEGELPMRFDLPLAAAIVEGAKEGRAGGIAAQLAEIARRDSKGAIDIPFLTPRDGSRVATQLGGDLGREKSAAAVLLTLPGAPFLSSGEELGLEKLTLLPWDGKDPANVAAEASDPNSLLSHYRFLIRARHNSEALRKGSLTLLTPAMDATPILAFLRTTPGETVLVLHNLGDTPVEAGPYQVPGVPDPYFVSPGVPPLAGGAGAWKVHLPPHGSGVWRMRVR